MKIKYFSILLLLLTSRCSLNLGGIKEEHLLGTWRLYNIEIANKEIKTEDSFSEIAALKKLVKDGELLCFFENKAYSDIKGEGEFKSGNWKLSDSKLLSFTDFGKIQDPIKIRYERNGMSKQKLIITDENKNIIKTFIKESDPLNDFTDDPFFPTNNLWRIKPEKSENSAQLSKRLGNYFKHFALILKSSKERKQDVVYFEFSKGPIKIYSGAIGIYPYSIVPESWKNTFFDEQEASTAYQKYQKYLATNSYKGAGIGDWVEDDYNILLSIYADFNQPNSD